MSSYKVAQDVEADDKLLGPFSFRQFIYLIVVALSGMLAWGLGSLLLPLAIIPLPAMLFFGALALPLRKDQPMETYLAAMISFYLKPRRRLWVPDGIQSLVEITVPQTEEVQLTKNLSEYEAARRLSYLADLSDSQGWSIRNAVAPVAEETSMRDDIYNEARQAEDLLDDQGTVARAFDAKITQADLKHRQELMARMNSQLIDDTSPTSPVAPPDPYANLAPAAAAIQPQAQPVTQPQIAPIPDPKVQFNPYPNIHQSVVQPLSQQAQVAQQPAQPAPPATPPPTVIEESTSENKVSPDIISLANNSDLSVETLAREANRLSQKKQEEASDEVVISLR
ncbi:MAG TPA: PrgI family protein [Candidatus Saccharibacteria bacterium]|nr:PrgI family protein [Candidatus Saccharibacteria bacterium]HMR38183.1 PrgI family protein [Candidatus Saccharibacteria bacterium]